MKTSTSQIKSFIRSELPTFEYLKYASGLLQPDAPYFFDPFAIDLRNYPQEEKESYVARKDVQDNLLGTRIFIGREGAGKSRILRYLDSGLSESYHTLFVNLPLAGMAMRDWGEDWMQGKVSCLTLEILVSYIFEAYWQNFINNASRRQRYINQIFDQDQVWLQRLHWFYNHYKPTIQEVQDDAVFTGWLNSPIPSPLLRETLSPEETFRHLIAMIIEKIGSRQKTSRPPMSSPYARIEIMVDDIEQISQKAAARLIREMQRLYDMRLGFKIFIPPAYEVLLDDLDCARQGRIATYHLPGWDQQDLVDLLARRVLVFSPGEPEGGDWGQYFHSLDTPARRRFAAIIGSSAMKVYGQSNEEQDAPVHALKIARAFLYANYECETKPKNPKLINKGTTKLSVDDLNTIAGSYWE